MPNIFENCYTLEELLDRTILTAPPPPMAMDLMKDIRNQAVERLNYILEDVPDSDCGIITQVFSAFDLRRLADLADTFNDSYSDNDCLIQSPVVLRPGLQLVCSAGAWLVTITSTT